VGRAERGERRNVRVLKANYIREFSVVSRGDDTLDPSSCMLDLNAIYAREDAALRCVNHCDLDVIYADLGCSCVGCCNEWITHLGETSTN